MRQVSNDLTGGFTQQDAGTASSTLTEVGTNAAGGFSIVQTSSDSSSQQESGNSISGNYSLALRLRNSTPWTRSIAAALVITASVKRARP